MTDRPIIFSGPMVRALLDGRKTQTRRLAVLRNGKPNPMTRWQAGDRCYVREAFTIVPASAYRQSIGVQQVINPAEPDQAAVYALGWDRSIPKWTPSIHMPRWASRLTLTVEQVRVEPLQSISGQDAEAEGVFRHIAPHSIDKVFRSERGATAIAYYRELWDSLHDEDGTRWDDNPEVVAITFAVAHGNIDQVQR